MQSYPYPQKIHTNPQPQPHTHIRFPSPPLSHTFPGSFPRQKFDCPQNLCTIKTTNIVEVYVHMHPSIDHKHNEHI